MIQSRKWLSTTVVLCMTSLMMLATVDGYKLRMGSPALASGTYTSAASMGTADYWGMDKVGTDYMLQLAEIEVNP
jgi:hypothetical protein